MPGFALLFPGQGSQYVGMGHDLYTASPAAKAVFDEADRAYQGRFNRLIFEGPAESLTDTVNAQPALFVTSMACWAALQEAMGLGSKPQPAMVAGHSLGEYTALAVAGTFSFATGLNLVCRRGQAMKEAGQAQPGRMAAVLGLATDIVAKICQEASARTGQTVVIANDNAPGQVVISGNQEALQVASEMAQAAKAKRVLPLAVSIAAHSPLLETAVAHFAPALHQAELHPPLLPVIANRDARPLTTVEGVVAELKAQLISLVQWTASIQYMVNQGISTFVEVGPKDVLTGLVKRIAPAATCIACGNMGGVEQAVQLLRSLAAQA